MDGSRRINKEFYDRIDAAMARQATPTIGQALDAMADQGNADYIREWSYIDHPDAIEVPLSLGSDVHDFGHLCTRLGHTPEQEQCTTLFDMGFNGFEAHEVAELPQHIAARHTHYEKGYKGYFKEGSTHEVPRPSKRDSAIYFAAGLYLRQKFESMPAAADYAAQQAFASGYASHDHTPRHFIGCRSWPGISRLPYDMVKLSPEEWRAVTAVATGLARPEDTPYPQRLAPIKEVLVASGLFYDLRARLSEAPASGAGQGIGR